MRALANDLRLALLLTRGSDRREWWRVTLTGLDAQVAAGVPYEVLGRALLLETALPLAPSVLVAGAGSTAIAFAYAMAMGDTSVLPFGALLVPVAVYGACLLAAATSLPLLRRTVRPAELRYV